MSRLGLMLIAVLMISCGAASGAPAIAPLVEDDANDDDASGKGGGSANLGQVAAIDPTAPAESVGTEIMSVDSGPADPADPDLDSRPSETEFDIAVICDLIESNAEAAGMPADFFARLLWKESRFKAGAISPVGAQGIAQFMPYTAEERGLVNPFDHADAIRHSALYLRDLKAELGNWGLAAAAYNGGINRVKRWRVNGGSLPLETEEYVNAITFRPAKWFRHTGREIERKPLDAATGFDDACRRLPVMKTRAVFASLHPKDIAALAVEVARPVQEMKKAKTGQPPAEVPKPSARPEPAGAILVAAPPPPPPPPPAWVVQVAGHHDQTTAMTMYRRALSSYPSILGGMEPLVERKRVGGPREIYAVRVGAPSRSNADLICNRLRSAGGACAVFRYK